MDFLAEFEEVARPIQTQLRNIVDMERQFARVCSLGTALASRKAVMYSDVVSKRLQEFDALLDAFETVDDCVSNIRAAAVAASEKRNNAGNAAGGNSIQIPTLLRKLCFTSSKKSPEEGEDDSSEEGGWFPIGYSSPGAPTPPERWRHRQRWMYRDLK